MSKPIPELQYSELVEGEVGEPVAIQTPAGTVHATWLGTVSNGKQLAQAMRLMAELAEERERDKERG